MTVPAPQSPIRDNPGRVRSGATPLVPALATATSLPWRAWRLQRPEPPHIRPTSVTGARTSKSGHVRSDPHLYREISRISSRACAQSQLFWFHRPRFASRRLFKNPEGSDGYTPIDGGRDCARCWHEAPRLSGPRTRPRDGPPSSAAPGAGGSSTPTPRHPRSGPGGPERTCRPTTPSPPRWAHHLRVVEVGEGLSEAGQVIDGHPGGVVGALAGQGPPQVLGPGQPGPLRLRVDGSDDVVGDVSDQDVGHACISVISDETRAPRMAQNSGSIPGRAAVRPPRES